MITLRSNKLNKKTLHTYFRPLTRRIPTEKNSTENPLYLLQTSHMKTLTSNKLKHKPIIPTLDLSHEDP